MRRHLISRRKGNKMGLSLDAPTVIDADVHNYKISSIFRVLIPNVDNSETVSKMKIYPFDGTVFGKIQGSSAKQILSLIKCSEYSAFSTGRDLVA